MRNTAVERSKIVYKDSRHDHDRSSLQLCVLEALHVKQWIQMRRYGFERSTGFIHPCKVLSIIDCEVEVMQGVVAWAVNDGLKEMTGDHVGIVNLFTNVR